MREDQYILVHGARTHNLKNISIKIPKNKLVVITGVSGSGKSSLAFDTIFAESQRQFVEVLSFQMKQFFEHLPKPDVDFIKGLCPAISLKQHYINNDPKSTVATETNVYDYLKLLFARIGVSRNGKRHHLEVNHFSFYSPYGACASCEGKGILWEIQPELLLDKESSLNGGAILPWNEENTNFYKKLIEKICKEYNVSPDEPLNKLPEEFFNMLLYGIPEKKFKINYKNNKGKYRTRTIIFEGIIKDIQKRYDESPSSSKKEKLRSFMEKHTCRSCGGYRLNKESLNIIIGGLNIGQITELSIDDALIFFSNLSKNLSEEEKQVSSLLIAEINKRLEFMKKIGLSYLTLNRPLSTLSSGEIQRLRLANHLSTELSGVLYVLDEPSIGLHDRDKQCLIDCLKNLRNLGNTVIVVEHDDDIMRAADYLIDLGPGAGNEGGEIIAAGSPRDIMMMEGSLTGAYLSGKKSIIPPKIRRVEKGYIKMYGCKHHNLKNIDVCIPLGVLVAITGVSGSGKSTLVNEILFNALSPKRMKLLKDNGKIAGIEGADQINKVIQVNQLPIGRTPRSTPATYTGIFDDIRELYSETEIAKKRGYSRSSFSFNIEEARCEECKGNGYLEFDMSFMSDICVTCPKCKGSRYKSDILEVKYKNKTIADILNMSVIEAMNFFEDEPKIKLKLQMLVEIGLGYIKLGQPSTTLSGGEAQRLKLATYLYKQDSGNDLYIFDEPTTGLHFQDIERLVGILERLVERGNTVIVIEHNLEVIKCSDYVIDLGPEGGINGGRIVASGTPQEVSKVKNSHTGRYLKEKFFS